VNGTRTNNRAIVGALTACVAVMAFIIFRIIGLMQRHDGSHHGLVLGLPLFCLACGWMTSLAWRDSNGTPAGPWRLIIGLSFFLGTILVAVIF